MMYLVRLFIISMLYISCSAVVMRNKDFDPYVRDFELNCKTKVFIPIVYAPLPEDTLGRCVGFRMPFFIRKIEINPNYWKNASHYEKESTMLHELGHCVLDLNHDENMIIEFVVLERPKSLMYPYEFQQYAFYRDEYRKSFFDQCK